MMRKAVTRESSPPRANVVPISRRSAACARGPLPSVPAEGEIPTRVGRENEFVCSEPTCRQEFRVLEHGRWGRADENPDLKRETDSVQKRNPLSNLQR